MEPELTLADLSIGDTVRLIGRTVPFKVVQMLRKSDRRPCDSIGLVSLCGGYSSAARPQDVILLRKWSDPA